MDLFLEHSYFPTSARRDTAGQHFEVTRPFDFQERPLNSKKEFKLSTELLQAAWAILLRSYIHSDTVSFAVLYDNANLETFIDHTKYTVTDDAFQASILQYHIHPSCRSHDVYPAVCHKISGRTLGDAHVNTAVYLLTPRSPSDIHRDKNFRQLPDMLHEELVQDFDIVLNVNTAKPSTGIFVSYRCPKISKQFAHAISYTLQKILTDAAFREGAEVGQIDTVSEEDKQRMILWNPKILYAQKNCMHYLVEAVARAMPASEAVCAWDGSLTYRQLDTLASVAAQSLVRAGVGPGVYVPFAYEKSLWTVVTTLAILKAGGAFVPLNPEHPTARLEEILKSINASVVVTSELFKNMFQGLTDHVIVISAKTVSLSCDSRQDNFCHPHVEPSDPIFVLFTSGSTGQPKGMILEHAAICTHAITHGGAMGYHGARVLQFAAHTFDVAIMDIFTTLLFGGCICIPSEEDRRNNITGVINKMKSDYAILTPSFAGLIDPAEVPTLRTLAVGGEALPQDRIERWADKVSLIQIYGPAEVGICLMMHMDITNTLPETVGYPLRNSSCWLVDPEDPNRLVPVGAVGEMVVAGPSLARGYLNNEPKTRSSFLYNLSWAKKMGLKFERFYKTGDLLKYNIDNFDGSYDFVGRKDTQIKLRGQRMELGEVEHHLASIPGVAVSMVVRPSRGCFAGELVAVVQMHGPRSSRVLNEPIAIAPNQSLSIETIKNHLSISLPGYMIPTACLEVNSMPFVPSLKINRPLVNTWLTEMSLRPAEVVATTWSELQASRLDMNELTANALSTEFAELVAQKDKARQILLAGHDFVLQRAGIDSIQIISFSMFLQKTYQVKIPIERLMSSKLTIRQLASLIDLHDQASINSEIPINIDILQETQYLSRDLFQAIGDQYSILNLGDPSPFRNILITGGTGYLGQTILQHLLSRPEMNVFALVRCRTGCEGLQRIITAANQAGWWQTAFKSRIQVWPGDLTKPNLGLESQLQQQLYGKGQSDLCIQAIIHNGAKIHYGLDYETLKPFNVHPTLSLLKATAQSPHISSLVFVSGGLKPSDDTNPSNALALATYVTHANGYAQSKYVSEHLVQDCVPHPAFQTKSLSIIKPGYIIGSLANPVAKQTDFIWRLVAGCCEIGAYNRDEVDHWLFIADVDCVARRVVNCLPNTGASGAVERVLDGLLFAELWRLLEADFGYELEPLEQEEWLGRLRGKVLESGQGHLLFPLLHTLEEGSGGPGAVDVSTAVGGKGSEAAMREVVGRNVRGLLEVGFLPVPGKRIRNGVSALEIL